MKNIFLITALLYSLNISANIKEKYQSTYNFINSMLTGEIPLSFKDAVFATEIAFYENDTNVEDLYNEMIEIIRKNKICKLLENIEIKNIGGFNFYNAFAFSRFGDNYLAVNTGIFFLSHTLVRSIELFFKENRDGIKIPLLLKKYLLRQFVKTSEAIICQNHLKSFSKIRLIASDDSLLTGIELFMVAHEYAHLLFKKINYNYSEISFNKYYDNELIDLINTNEEIAADAFAVIVIKYYQLTLKDYSIALYAPQFIFRVLSNYDELKFSRYSNTHPTNAKRYNYLKKMINTGKYDSLDYIVNNIWKKCKNKISKKCFKYERFIEKITSIWGKIVNIIHEEIETQKMNNQDDQRA